MPRRRNGGATYKPTSSVIRAVAPGNGMQTVSAMPTGLFLIAATVASNAWPRSRRQPAAVAVINGARPCCSANARAICIKTGMSLTVAERNFNTVLSLSSIVSMPASGSKAMSVFLTKECGRTTVQEERGTDDRGSFDYDKARSVDGPGPWEVASGQKGSDF